MSNDEILENKINAAIRMHREGFEVTFSKPNSKIPKFTNWLTAKDEGEIRRYLTENPRSNAMLLTQGFIVVDSDMGHYEGQDGIGVLRDWELENGELPETWTVITGKGGLQYYYRQREGEPARCREGGKSGMLNDNDIRADGGLVMCPGSVHPETGRIYEFEVGYSPDDIQIEAANDTVYKLARWGLDNINENPPFEVPEIIPEGQRHSTLLSMASSMRAKKYSLSATLAAVKAENSDRCKPPYSDDEVESLVMDVFTRYKAGTSNESSEDSDDESNSPPKHIKLVREMTNRGFVFVDDMPCIPGKNGFEFGWKAIHRAMTEFDPWSLDRTRKEAVKTLMYQGREEPAANPRFIGFTNGVLDVMTMKLVTTDDFSSKGLGIVPVVIPHEYKEDATECGAVETLLDGVSCNDAEIRLNLEECIGLCMSRYADNRSSAIWLYGTGENGKSTYIDALEFLVGKSNSCALMLDDLKGQFNTQMLVGKLLAISDDQPAGALDKSVIGYVKKIVTGQPIKIEPKGIDPYNATLFATIITTSNEPPQLGDTTHGSLRRWHMIPLKANFGEDDSGRDVNLKEKLHTEQAAQWLIKLGIDGLRRVLTNEGMTETVYSRTAIQEARERSNSVFAFLAEHPRSEFLADPNVEVWYWEYQEDTKNKGGRPFEQAKFSQMVSTEYEFTTSNNGRYKVGDYSLGVNGLAREHGRKPGDKYRVFVDARSQGASAGQARGKEKPDE